MNHENESIHPCPLVNRDIEDGICAETAMYAEGDHHYNPMPEALELEGYEDICNKCPYHIWD